MSFGEFCTVFTVVFAVSNPNGDFSKVRLPLRSHMPFVQLSSFSTTIQTLERIRLSCLSTLKWWESWTLSRSFVACRFSTKYGEECTCSYVLRFELRNEIESTRQKEALCNQGLSLVLLFRINNTSQKGPLDRHLVENTISKTTSHNYAELSRNHFKKLVWKLLSCHQKLPLFDLKSGNFRVWGKYSTKVWARRKAF